MSDMPESREGTVVYPANYAEDVLAYARRHQGEDGQYGSVDFDLCAIRCLVHFANLGLSVAFPSEEDLERAAKRICVARHYGKDGAMAFSWGVERNEYIRQARAALAALSQEGTKP